jgi:hypothetical protein
MNKNKIKNSIIAILPVFVVLLIQYFDKENNYRFVQYVILSLMIIYLIYFKFLKKKINY